VPLSAEQADIANPMLEDSRGAAVPCQILPGEKPALCFILKKLGRGEEAAFTLVPGKSAARRAVVLEDVAGEKVDVRIGGALFTSYRYASTWARPFLMPIIGAYGDPVTRRFPVERVAGEAQDHPHHKSCWVAWGDVNGTDNWSEEEGHGRQVHEAFESIRSGPVFGRLTAVNRWVAKSGGTQLRERRTLTFYHLPRRSRCFDLTVAFEASEGPVTFGDTKEGGIVSVRVATSMDAKLHGTITNAYGGVNEGETWGKRAHWCDYAGPVNGKTVGIAIFDTPGNFRYPTYWHVRNYGLMTANPFGLSHFYGDKARNGSHTIAQGSVFAFSYRLYFHAGDARKADVAGRFLDYVAPPAATVS
jgi:hypothetical protein